MFRSHPRSFGRTHTAALGLFVAGLLSTSVEAAAAPDLFVLTAHGDARSASAPGGAADSAATRLLGRLARGAPGAGGVQTRHCVAEALTLIAGRSACDGSSEELAPQAFGPGNRPFTQGHRDVPHPQRLNDGRRRTDKAE